MFKIFLIENVFYLQLLRDVREEEDGEDAELQASIASANKWRKMAALTRQRAAQVLTSAVIACKTNWVFLAC